MMRRSALALLLVCACGSGCEAPPSSAKPTNDESVDLSRIFTKQPIKAGTPVRAKDEGDALPSHLNSPMAAAKELATAPPVRDRAAERQIQLHSTLYRAAMNSDSERYRSGYLLRPIARDAAAQRAMSNREFDMRVLASFVAGDQRVAWDDESLAWMLQDNAPGGPAAFVWFEIVRIDEQLATIEADVCIETLQQGTRKARVEAIYDGQAWNIHDLGIRTIW